MAEFSGKKVVIIGGSRGMGASMVKRFASLGANTVFTYAASEEAAQSVAGTSGAQAVRVDSRDRDAVVKFIAGQGPIDVLIISAGTVPFGPAASIDSALIDEMLEVNWRSPYFGIVEASKTMPNGGRIILIGSAAPDRVTGEVAAYASIKGSYRALVSHLAREWGDRDITINVIQPGNTDTDKNPADSPYADYQRSMSAIKKHISPEEIADMALYLSGPSGRLITGAVINVDAGLAC
jgi:cyclic-di-GMP-binding biofilm dispersal mediator protein